MISTTLRGAFSKRPAATSVRAGTIYTCSDVPFAYISDGSNWFQHQLVPFAAPAAVGNWTTVGKLLLNQWGDSILATSYVNGTNSWTCALQAGLSGLSTWIVTGCMYGMPKPRIQYGDYGICVTNGTSSGSSVMYATGNASSDARIWHSFQGFVGASTRSNEQEEVSVMEYGAGMGGASWFRILADSANHHYQTSQDGQFWWDFSVLAQPAGITNWGFYLGNGNAAGTTGECSALVTECFKSGLTTPQQAVSGATGNLVTPIVLTVPSTAGFMTGDLASCFGVTGNTNANVTLAEVQVQDPTHLALLNTIGNGAYIAGGTVTLLSR